MSEIIDEKITELFNVLTKQKADVEAAKKESERKWITNCSIPFKEYPVNIQTANEETILHSVSRLLQEQDYAKKAAELLGLEPNSKFGGYAYSSWFDDCKKRIASLALIVKKNKLAELETRLNAIISPEQRRKLELDAITKELVG